MSGQPEVQINLINYKLEQKSTRQTMMKEWGIYLLIALLLVGGLFVYSNSMEKRIAALEKENASLQAELKQTTVQASTTQTGKKIEAAMKTRSLVVHSLQKMQNEYVPVFEELGDLNGSGILFTSIDVQNNTVNTRGYASSHGNLVALLQALRDSEQFSDPANLQLSTDEDTREISFSMQMGLEVEKE
ncbi:MAG TPA: PilN domain-containing protein [Syntrophomonas sp.]|nr:PilN domain-containing protein [Syntrophomonas sp.]HRW13385.1 PilN domain-containing protein [Syntrophomonas sp.]